MSVENTAVDECSYGGTVLSESDGRTFAAIRSLVQSGDEVWIVVTGSSMLPTLKPGDRVLLTHRESEPLTGRIVFAECRARPVLHRVVAYEQGLVVTAGDNCIRSDAPIPQSAVVAQAEAVYSTSGLSALRLTLRFGIRPLARYLLLEARALAYGVWRRTRYRQPLRIWIWGRQ